MKIKKTDKTRDKKIQISVTALEKKEIETAAQDNDRSVSNWSRPLLLIATKKKKKN